MFIAKSTEYQLLGYDSGERMWKLKRIATPSRPQYRELILTSEAKYIQKADDSSFYLGADGEKVLVSKGGVKQYV
jgi:hypothetical protein